MAAPHGGGRAGQASGRNARKDRNTAEVMQLPRTSAPGRGGAPVLHIGALAEKVTNVIGNEDSRADQPDARPCDERRNRAGSNAPPIAVCETHSRT